MNRKRSMVIGGVIVLVLAIAMVWWLSRSGDGTGSRAATGAVRNPIKVGMLLSHATASSVEWNNRPWGYDQQMKIFPMMDDEDIDLYPVLEPGSQDDNALQVDMKFRFAGKTPIDGSDPEQLRGLKVVVAWSVWHTDEKVLSALASVVEKDGVGFLQGCGFVSHKFNISDSHVLELAGLEHGAFGYNPNWVDCAAVGENPILGGLSGKLDETFKLSPNGWYGTLPKDATPLVKIVNSGDIRLWSRQGKDMIAYPVYLSSFGKGRIVGIQVGPNDPMTALQTATGGKFVVRCIKWLANEPLD